MCNTAEHREIKGQHGFLIGSDGVLWTSWRRGKNGRILRSSPSDEWTQVFGFLSSSGYIRVPLFDRVARLHHLVLEAFIGPQPFGMVTRHLDGIKVHNWLSNLAWGTQSENLHDCELHGTSIHGERNHNAKLTENDVLNTRALAEYGITVGELTDMYGVSQSAISNILMRKRWPHI